ncbi:MAG: PTS sugar transporter subunit IIA [Thermodesulfobacteria bacterium]|nr:PTS sugar transporter subunit IIA [Thermodesulfobacteriota bacterium]
MIGVVVAAHGNLAQELVQTTGFIVGDQENVVALTVDPSRSVEEMKQAIKKAIKQVDTGDGILILTDMFGGTPANMSLSFLEEGKVEVITGVNLPMLIRLSQCRESMTLAEAAQSIVEYARKSINQATQILNR